MMIALYFLYIQMFGLELSHEINLWIPLVDCYKTKSMYILENKYMNRFNYDIKNQQITNSRQIFNLVKKNKMVKSELWSMSNF